jgi:hypothetical protein
MCSTCTGNSKITTVFRGKQVPGVGENFKWNDKCFQQSNEPYVNIFFVFRKNKFYNRTSQKHIVLFTLFNSAKEPTIRFL